MLAAAIAATALLGLSGCAAEPEGAAGTWGSSEQGQPQLELAKDGKLSGTDGCNRLVGNWSEKGGVVEFGQVASTMMACQDVDTWLSGLVTGEVNGDELIIKGEGGKQIGTLKRQAG